MSDSARTRTGKSVVGGEGRVTWAQPRALLATVLAGAWTGYFLFTGMPQLTLEVFPATLTLHLMFAGAAVVYLASLAVSRRLPGGTPLDLPVLAIAAAWAIATFASVSWRASLEPALLLGAGIIAFYALADLPFLSAMSLRRALLLTGGALSLYAVWVVGNDYADYISYVRAVEGLDRNNIFPPTVPRVHDVSDHPNVLAMLLALFMPFFALAAYRSPAVWERLLGAAALVAGVLAIFLTLSRGGWLGAAAGTLFAVVAGLMTSRAWDREQRGFARSWDNLVPRDISPTALAAIGGALVLVVGGTLAFLSSATTRPGWLFRSSLSPREDAWRAGLDIFGDNALTGAGPNSFGLLYPQYSGEFLIHTQHAHNGFLQVADDAGVLGLLALGALAAALIYMLLRTWREGDLEQRLLAVACAGGLIGFSVHNLVDAGNTWKAPLIALALVGAISARNYRERAHATEASWPSALRRYGAPAVRGALLALLFLPFVAWWRIDSAHYDYWRGLDAANAGDFGGIARLQEAVDADSSVMVYRMQLGQQQAALYQAQPEGDRDEFLIRRAIVNLEEAADLDPRSDLVHANLARAYQLAGRDADAAREAQLTRLAVRHVPPVLAVGEVYEDLIAGCDGPCAYEEDAVSTYGQVISMDAGLAGSSFWQGTPWRREHFAEIIAASSLGINPCTLGSYVVQARRLGAATPPTDLGPVLDGCKLLLFSAPNDLVLRTALARILLDIGDREEALGHLRYAVDRQPDFGPARTELGRWYAEGGDIEEARHQWVVGSQLDEAESVLLLGRSYGDPALVPDDVRERLRELLVSTGTSVQNDVISVLYYRLRYGRTSPRLALIPGDWQTAVPAVYAEMRDALARWDAAAGD